jgi:hypothetical protein
MGRGGFVNSHPGHRQYMTMVQDKKLEYVSCKNSAKIKVSNEQSKFVSAQMVCYGSKAHPLNMTRNKNHIQIAWAIVKDLRSLDPPARFLQKDRSTGLWNDVGDKKFRAKVSQALREHQPFIKALMDIEDDTTAMHSKKRTRTGSFPDLETISEKPTPAVMGLPHLCNTEDRRRAFATSRVEAVSALGNEDSFGCPVEHSPNVAEFTVSDFTLCDESFSTFPSSGMPDCLAGSASFPAQLPGGAFSGYRSSNSMISLYETLEEHDYEDGRIERTTVRPFPCRDLMKRESSHNNETLETKRSLQCGGSVKRCVLNRDKSDIARKLREFCSDFNTIEQPRCDASETEMDSLLEALERGFVFP